MSKLENTVNAVLEQLKPKLAKETWQFRRQGFNRMLKCADALGIDEPCIELYDAFIADGHSSPGRRAKHVKCVKLVDAFACTQAKNEYGVLFNEPPMPNALEAHEVFPKWEFPITSDACIDHLIVKAEFEMMHLDLTKSTIGQYKHSWMAIRRYFYDTKIFMYDEAIVKSFIQRIASLHDKGLMKYWKWRTNHKAALLLMEVANTGHIHWERIRRNDGCDHLEIELIRLQYIEWLTQQNLSKSTIEQGGYVFRRTIEFTKIETRQDILMLSPEIIQLAIRKFSEKCIKQSMVTMLRVLRSILRFLHSTGLTQTDLSGIAMGGFIQRGSVATYLSEKDQANIVSQLDFEPKRTKAVILLALHLGLRDCDICNLTFREIDWQNDKIRLLQKKTGEPLVLPLLSDVGNALMDYILNERHKRADHYPYIFLRGHAPYNKLKKIYPICSKFLGRLGIKPINGTATGAHLFRYSMVHKLLVTKVPHQIITNILGHTSKESDKPYLSMEESMLQLCTLNLSVVGTVSLRGGAIDD